LIAYLPAVADGEDQDALILKHVEICRSPALS
jgi:hypothetical protein